MFSPKGHNIFSQSECHYFANLLMKQPTENAAEDSPESTDLDYYYERVKVTIEALNANMVKPEISDQGFFQYYSPCNLSNVVSLLRRGKQLYEMRAEATKIIQIMTEVEYIMMPRQLLWRYFQDQDDQPLPKGFTDLINTLVQLITKGLQLTTLF